MSEKPKVKLVGRDGNAFAIIAACKTAARKAKWSDEQIKDVTTQMMRGDYNHLLQVALTHFDVE